jgi:REP element-mobilizing transposase RayT
LRLLVDYIDLLRQAFRYVRRRHPFDIEAIVVLPDHLHAIWMLPEGDADFALRWRLIKSMFSRGLPAGERTSASRAQKGERGIWQRRYWEHTLRDEEDFARYADYIHFNPVKHGHVSPGPRLAVFVVSSHGQVRRLPARLGGRCGRQSLAFRRKMMGFAAAQPILRATGCVMTG